MTNPRSTDGGCRGLLTVAFACLATMLITAGMAGAQSFPEDQWKKLDGFEANRLAKADQLFTNKDYRSAIAAYDAFLLEFPRSPAVPYAILKKGRSIQLDEKRFQATKVYEEVLDYFPNVIEFAAPALFYTGECHWQNGDIEKAMKSWLEMATDKDYRKHVLAAHAVNSLAENLLKQNKAPEAMKYFEQVALDFRFSNGDPAYQALDKLIWYNVRVKPNDPKLREIWRERGTFHRQPRNVPKSADVALDTEYWKFLWDRIDREGRYGFNEIQKAERQRFYKYWAGVFTGKHPKWEDFQIKTADYQRAADGNVDNWVMRMDEIFQGGYKEGDYRRVFRWMEYYRGMKPKIMEYCKKISYNKLPMGEFGRLLGILARDSLHVAVFNEVYKSFNFDTMKNSDIKELAFIIYRQMKNVEMGRSTILKLRFQKMDDKEIAALAKELWRPDGAVVKPVCLQINDKDLGKMELLRFFHSLAALGRLPEGLNTEEVRKERIDLASYLSTTDQYSTEALWMKAECLDWDTKYKEAIAAYRTCDNPPENLWPIIQCYLKMGNWQQAIQELVEIENFFRNLAPKAAMMQADIYGRAGKKNEQIGALRRVMKKYKLSGESRSAHQQLEKMGVKIGGGADADEEKKQK